MICLLILTGHEGLLEAEIRDDMSGELDGLKGTPRALLPSGVGEKKIIDIWWDSVSKRHMFDKGTAPTPCITALYLRTCRHLMYWSLLCRGARSVPDHECEQVQALRTMGNCPRLSDVRSKPYIYVRCSV